MHLSPGLPQRGTRERDRMSPPALCLHPIPCQHPGEASLGRKAVKGMHHWDASFSHFGDEGWELGGPGPLHALPMDVACGQGKQLRCWHRGTGECRTALTAQAQPQQLPIWVHPKFCQEFLLACLKPPVCVGKRPASKRDPEGIPQMQPGRAQETGFPASPPHQVAGTHAPRGCGCVGQWW